jgi:hypothetical protein
MQVFLKVILRLSESFKSSVLEYKKDQKQESFLHSFQTFSLVIYYK